MIKQIRMQLKNIIGSFRSNKKKFTLKEFDVIVNFIINRSDSTKTSNSFLQFIISNQNDLRQEIVENTDLKKRQMVFLYLSKEKDSVKNIFDNREDWLFLTPSTETIRYLSHLKILRTKFENTKKMYLFWFAKVYGQVALSGGLMVYVLRQFYENFVINDSFRSAWAETLPALETILEFSYIYPVVLFFIFTTFILLPVLRQLYKHFIIKETNLAKQMLLLKYHQIIYFLLLKNYIAEDDLIDYIPFKKEMQKSTQKIFENNFLLRDDFLELDRFFGWWSDAKLNTNHLTLNSYLNNAQERITVTQRLYQYKMSEILQDEKENFKLLLESYNIEPTKEKLNWLTWTLIMTILIIILTSNFSIAVTMMPDTANMTRWY